MKKQLVLMMLLTAVSVYAALPITDGLVCRLDAANAVQSEGKVSQITDLSGLDNHAVQANSDNMPDFVYFSGLPMVYFSDVSKSIAVAHNSTLDTDPNSSLTVFVAGLREGELATGTQSILHKGSSTWNAYNSGNVGWSMWFWKATSGILNRVVFQVCSTYPTYTHSVSGAAPYDSVAIDDFFVASTVIRASGVDKTVILEVDPEVTGGATSKGLVFRESLNSTSDLVVSSGNLYIGEILIYNRPLSDVEIASIRTYLDEKYVLIPEEDCASVWAAGEGNPADFNQDCYVDFDDFVYLAQQWLFCNDPQNPDCD